MTKTGKIQQWTMEINIDKPFQYRTISGQVAGKVVISSWRTAKIKNIGKANERTPEKQAIFVIEAAYTKRLKQDYYKDIDDAHKGSRIYECMLAEEYDKRLLKKVSKSNPELDHSNLYSQPKLNGMRCLAMGKGLYSRGGEDINSVPHIYDELRRIFDIYPDLVIDGELYNHDLHDDFNELMSIFKKLNPTREDLKKSSEIGQFHIYDLDILYDTSRYNTSTGQIIHKDSLFSERSAALKDIHETFMKSDSMIILTETTKIHNKIELNAMYNDYAARNYEGQMVRDDSPYMNHRTKHILKRKKFHDAEYELVDILQGEGNWEGKAKRAVLRDRKTGEIFGAGILGDMKYCANILSNKDKYIGSETTVNYQVLSPDKNVPIFGRVKEFGRTDNLKFYGK